MSTTNRILHGDCRDTLRTLADCSVDSIVTDPPYELGFMGKHWDASGIAYDLDLWRECLRVLKPGGHLLAFGGTRTWHRMAVAIEDAGFEVRDSIHWLYGSGFPKSLDVSKAIDKQRDDRADIYRVTAWVRAARDTAGITNRDIDAAFGFAGMAGHWTSSKSQPSVPTPEQVPVLLDVLGVAVDDVPDEIRRLLWDLNGRKGQPGENWWKREVTGQHEGHVFGQWVTNHGIDHHNTAQVKRDVPATDAARQWTGWGTALKPAHEPIVVARKPLVGTVAQNVLQHGTGALNIDGGRVATSDVLGRAKAGWPKGGYVGGESTQWDGRGTTVEGGRWPANLVLTHAADCADTCAADCPVAELDRQSGIRNPGHTPAKRGKGGISTSGHAGQDDIAENYTEAGGASRFFTVTEWDSITDVPFRYVAKPGKTERNAGLDGLPEQRVGAKGNGLARRCASCDASVIDGCDCSDRTFINPARANHHPTVKPVDLMRWLVRLVTPPGGTVLDPFLGSGTTAVAAILEGFNWVGCELTDDYLPIIEGRTAWAQQQVGYVAPTRVTSSEPDQLALFS